MTFRSKDHSADRPQCHMKVARGFPIPIVCQRHGISISTPVSYYETIPQRPAPLAPNSYHLDKFIASYNVWDYAAFHC